MIGNTTIVAVLGGYRLIRKVFPIRSASARGHDLAIMTAILSLLGLVNAFHGRYSLREGELLDPFHLCEKLGNCGQDFSWMLGVVAFWTVVKGNSFNAGCVTVSFYISLIVADLITPHQHGFWHRVTTAAMMTMLLIWASITLERKSREVICDKSRLQKMTEERDKLMKAQHATFAKITHDLRTPLNGIINSADFLRHDLEEEIKLKSEHPIFAYVDIMSSAGEYMLLLTNNLLEISRLTAKQQRHNSGLRENTDRLALPPSASFQERCCGLCRTRKAATGAPDRRLSDDGSLRGVKGHHVAALTDIFDLHNDWLDLRAALRKVFHLHIPTTRLKKISYQLPSLSHLPLLIYADGVRIQQAANNLLSNAVKMTDKGSVCVSVSATAVPDPTEAQPPPFEYCKDPTYDMDSLKVYDIEIRITDSGRGIPKEKLSSLFKEFRQVNAKDALIGTGLGLSIAKMVCQAMGGDCWLESEGVNKGTTAILSFKCYGVFEASSTAAANKNRERFSPYTQRRNLKHDANLIDKLMADIHRLNIHLILADDDFINRQCVASILKKMGVAETSMTWALNGVELVDAVKERLRTHNTPVFVLTDLEMPEPDGVASARCIREHLEERQRTVEGRTPPFFMSLCTAQSKENVIANHPEAPGLFDTAFVEKPVSRWVLKELMERFVSQIDFMATMVDHPT
ncbi:unnamed protein product [Vitrella brassicaformis CCMP3155]|uniref:histidine kinase n=3 Tax=Vitrella brassicaformis TaxID=1169539 RepID=A0A0G4EDR0_VITBC|nr:unnamed protein product [Vitrella brassicaformis CCMP3155]|mmetsp:Transcript_35648/g.88679  ORF Transcript_35648/g.88679 Transcript_35648/m.88679 type:complete len:686 (+) Transcript_35648:293-2350(+)|eukprot:CEL93665.1 unnamed protein product [Vitrella brassicaformis CCMP3155]